MPKAIRMRPLALGTFGLITRFQQTLNYSSFLRTKREPTRRIAIFQSSSLRTAAHRTAVRLAPERSRQVPKNRHSSFESQIPNRYRNPTSPRRLQNQTHSPIFFQSGAWTQEEEKISTAILWRPEPTALQRLRLALSRRSPVFQPNRQEIRREKNSSHPQACKRLKKAANVVGPPSRGG